MSGDLPGKASMNVQRIIALLEACAESEAEATGACLPPERLAAYHDGHLRNGERATTEEHLAVCDHCLGQLAALSRAFVEQDKKEGQEKGRTGAASPRSPTQVSLHLTDVPLERLGTGHVRGRTEAGDREAHRGAAGD